jgi:hypothetical protein
MWGAAPESDDEIWNSATYEDDPEAGDPLGQGDDHIRELKEQIRERAEVEHHWGTDHTDDTGLHKVGSSRCYAQSAAPTTLPDSKTDHVPGTGGQTGVSNLNTDATAGAEDVGLGRCWIDTDDMTVYTYSVVEIEGTGAVVGWHPVDVGEFNYLYNGSFEVDDGAGTPDGWTDAGLGAVATAAVTDTIYGEGFAFTGTGDAGGDDQLQQTLDGLHASTTYLVYGLVNPTAGDTCRLFTTGAGTQADVTSSNAGGFEVLLDTFVTDGGVAVPATAVVLNLESVANTDVCEWDHVAVVEYAPSRRQLPERIYDRACTAWNADGNTTLTDVEALTIRLQNPWPKAVVRLGADNLDFSGGGAGYVDAAWERPAATAISAHSCSAAAAAHSCSLEATFLDTDVAAGTEYVYNLATTTSVVTLVNNSLDFCIWLEAYPL